MSEEINQHQEYAEESRRLKRVVSYMWEEIDNIQAIPPTYALKDELQRRHQNLNKRQALYSMAIPSAYFGRFDFRAEDENATEEFYISKELYYGAIPHSIIKVVSWKSPIASVFYERRGEVSYTSPGGQIDGAVFLRRQFNVLGTEIESIIDTFDRREKPSAMYSGDVSVIDPDEYLRLVLEGRRGRGLTEVVTSIQQRQNQIMRADRHQILIVQGPAGSGKTTIALHRIAILLYPHDDQPLPTVMFVGANKFFLSFVKQVLPSLNVSGVRQLTFADWVTRLTGQRAEFRDLTRDEVFSNSLMDDDERRKIYERGKLKGSLKIRSWLKTLSELHRIKLPQDGLAVYPTGLGSLGVLYDVSSDEMQQLLKETESMPVNRQRDSIVGRVADILFEKHLRGYRTWMSRIAKLLNHPPEQLEPALLRRWEEQLLAYGYIKRGTSIETGTTDLAESKRKRALSSLKNEILRLVSAEFPRISVIEAYLGFVSSYDTLLEVAGLKDFYVVLNRADRLIERTGQNRSVAQAVRKIRDVVANLKERMPKGQIPKKSKNFANDKKPIRLTDEEVFRLYDRLLDMQKKPFEEINILFDDKAQASQLRVEDLAAVCYLHLLFEGFSDESYMMSDHIIVDEAQDMSPLEMWLLRQFVSSGSMTILGDLAQSIHSYRGISSWYELQDVFEGDKITYEPIDVAYRSTYEIMEFANRVLEGELLREASYPKAQPFPRHGKAVEVLQVTDKVRLRQAIVSEVTRLESQFSTVAVICKTREECQEVYGYLPKGSATLMVETPSQGEVLDYNTKVFVLPSFLAKGVEFDACIVANANHVNYRYDELHGRLLYVAITRALHELVVMYLGEPSRHLPVGKKHPS